MLGRLVVPAIVALVLIAGCVTPAANDVDAADAAAPTDLVGDRLPPPAVDLSTAIVSDHGAPYMHAIPDLHTGSYRMELVGYNPLTQPTGGDHPLNQNSAWTAVTIHEHLACVAHWVGTSGFGGATIVDFDDPANPTVVASILDLSLGSRCMFTEDGKFLLVASYAGANPGLPLPAPLGNALSYGVSVYDVSDPSNPQFLLYDEQGSAPGDTGTAYHNVWTSNIGGANYIFQTYTGNVLKLADDGTSMEIVSTLEYSDHDYWVGKHPITGEWMAVTGAGDGTAFFNVDDPSVPVLRGVWEGNESYVGWHRQFPLEETVDGRAIMVVAGEECGNGKSLPYTVLDWTDPENVIELGHWQIPGNPEITEPGQLCSMNSHEFETWNGYVASGNYHAGVWLFDVGSAERIHESVTIGYYEPHEDPRAHGGTRNTPFAWSPDVWGAYFDDRGYVIAADWYTGFYVLSFPATMGVAEAQES